MTSEVEYSYDNLRKNLSLLLHNKQPTQEKGRNSCAAYGYPLPHPDLLCAVQSEDKLILLLSSWLCLRVGLLARFNSHYLVTVQSHQLWRTILQTEWFTSHGSSTNA
ncbi:uncharacterized protein EV420DRAFT_1490882 [Desarmillaria tabescens]|uniref:Uncharacterized protein n=1 Tax=Armillaria tabescens TaxID=1929756 RepID=A0AA39IVM7_ARMTA|nr:uncharacterized protein EV420DRAFT_1490882 [Desarmillaria tabescens]KAK0431305.1 hypothetical protein EV420DRAFT_1490882 [Desarmillaria tabescens]